MIVAMHLQANSWMNKVFLSANSFLRLAVYPAVYFCIPI